MDRAEVDAMLAQQTEIALAYNRQHKLEVHAYAPAQPLRPSWLPRWGD